MKRLIALVLMLLGVVLLPGPGASAREDQTTAVISRQAAEYAADRPKTIVELQQFRRTTSATVIGYKDRRGTASLIEINPEINAWFLLGLDWGGHADVPYHIENPRPGSQEIHLSDKYPYGLQLVEASQSAECPLWSEGPLTVLERARRSGVAYAPLCDGRLYLRNPVTGHATPLESVTSLLRKYLPGGENVIDLVRRQLYHDRFFERGVAGAPSAPQTAAHMGPRSALLDPGAPNRTVVPEHLGIAAGTQALAIGQWYPVDTGIFVGAIQAQDIAPNLLRDDQGTVGKLDMVEASALTYLVAFDLADFDLNFTVGTEHPGVDWSDHAADEARDARLPGPDGVGNIAPLVATGMVSPAAASRVAATFTGGFKRDHGAFRYGALAQQHHASHYGFIEGGAVLSKLQPGLATLTVSADGAMDMKTWTAADDASLPHIKYARQNGVPLIDYDPARGVSAPGALVNRWGPGNWSGSASGTLRSVRAGVCLQTTAAGRFLIYGYFSDATPSAMARVFQAYQCRYAMHLDMNALEHTYLAVYPRKGAGIDVQHLIQGMIAVDVVKDGAVVPRFLGVPDNRDFFSLLRRGSQR